MAELTNEQKKRLKEVLYGISDKEEKTEMTALEKAELTAQFSELQESMAKMRTEFRRMGSSMTESYGESMKELLSGLVSLREGYEAVARDMNPNAAPVYKDMINAISKVEDAVTKKPVPNWRWPQYASVSVRDKNFANVNPSIAPFNITSAYDDVVLSNYNGNGDPGLVQYYENGSLVAELTLTYSGSNLTEVARTA